MSEMARILILLGCVLVVTGLVLTLVGKVPGVGRLPGDIMIKKENFTFYAPITTSILLSIVLSLIMYFLNRR